MDVQSRETTTALNAENECMETNEEGEAETQGPAQSETQPTQTVYDSNRSVKADVWKEFLSVGIGEDGKERGRCIHCRKKFVIERNLGTLALRCHLLCCPRPKYIFGGNDMVGVSASKSSGNRQGLSNVFSKKRRRSSISESKTRSAMLLGLDILDCPVCFEALTIPIFQCDNGHLVCSSCCPKLSNKCPACAFPIGHSRCRAMEIVLESAFVPCQNAKFGCTKNVSYGKESTHEKECSFSQCSCPALDCNYTGSYSSIYSHFVDKHGHKLKSISFECGASVDVQFNIASGKILVLCESKKGLLFALQCFSEPQCVYVTVRCIAPAVPDVETFAYWVYYCMDGHDLTYKSPGVKRVREVSSQTPQDNFMVIPRCLLRGELLELRLCIGLKFCVYA